MNKSSVITFAGIISIAVIATLSLPLTPVKAEAEHDEHHDRMGKMDMKKGMEKHVKADVLTLEKIHSGHLLMVARSIEEAIKAIEAGNNKDALAELHKAKKMLADINKAVGGHIIKPKFVNTQCPIFGTPIEPDKVTDNLIREYKGQKVAFCCKGCPAKWDKLTEAEKNAKLAKARPKPELNETHSEHKADEHHPHEPAEHHEEKGHKADEHTAHEQAQGAEHAEALPAGANQMCPVQPEEKVDPAFYAEYKGKRIYVCCNKCAKRVREDPAAWYDKAYGHDEHDH